MEGIEALLGYTFRNRLLLKEALTHPSVVYETQVHQPDNQRLEFLGDAVLNLVITQLLFDRFGFEEGLLTKLRARLVSRPALASYARKLSLGEHMVIGKSEVAAGGRNRVSSMADCFEALIGAIYLDSGLESARSFVIRHSEEAFREIVASPLEINPKGELQEVVQRIKPVSPVYEVLESAGPDHAKIFRIRVVWEGHILGEGNGASKKEAEVNAAVSALSSKVLADLQAQKAKASATAAVQA